MYVCMEVFKCVISYLGAATGNVCVCVCVCVCVFSCMISDMLEKHW